MGEEVREDWEWVYELGEEEREEEERVKMLKEAEE